MSPEHEAPEAENDSSVSAAEVVASGPGLFSPGRFGPLAVRNRVVFAPLPTGLGGTDGFVSPELIEFLAQRARGGCGLIMTEPMSVAEGDSHESVRLSLATNDAIAGLRNLHDVLREAETPLAVTLTRAPVDDVVSLAEAELAAWPEAFAKAAWRAQTAGAEAVTLQFGTGHGVGQLLSPATNQRDDDYGGDLDDRLKLPLAILAAVRRQVTEAYPVIVSLTLDERIDGGLTGEEALEAAVRIAATGVEGVLVTVGTVRSLEYEAPCHYVQPLPAPPLAARVKAAVSASVIVTGGIRTPLQARELIAGGQADFVGMPRALVADPQLPNKLQDGRPSDIVPCIGCNQACVVGVTGGVSLRCVTNPRAGSDHTPLPLRLLNQREMIVVGGGPAGVVAALTAWQRNFRVTLFEADEELGGRFRLACVPPGKRLLGRYVDWLQQALPATDVLLHLGERADYETIRGRAPEVVVIATGASLDLPETIAGITEPLRAGFVVKADEVLSGAAAVGERVMIVGARRVGLETADLLASDGRRVVVCDSSQAPDAFVPATVRPLLDSRLRTHGVEVLPEATVVRVRDTVVFVRHRGHVEQFDNLDTLVVACGWRRNDELAARLAEHIQTVIVVGDAKKPRTALAAISEAYAAVAGL